MSDFLSNLLIEFVIYLGYVFIFVYLCGAPVWAGAGIALILINQRNITKKSN